MDVYGSCVCVHEYDVCSSGQMFCYSSAPSTLLLPHSYPYIAMYVATSQRCVSGQLANYESNNLIALFSGNHRVLSIIANICILQAMHRVLITSVTLVMDGKLFYK